MIEQESVSFEAIEQDFLDYLSELPDTYKWKDQYEDSVGQTLIELLAGFGSFLGTRILLTRREAFLSTALLRSSVQGIAGSNLGYSVYRGRNPHVQLTVTASSPVTLNKFQSVGSYGQYDVVMATQQSLVVGSNVVEVIIGDTKTSSQLIQTNDPTTFRFYDSGVSEDYFVDLNGNEVPVSSEYKDLLEDYYLAITNYLNSVDVSYLNDGSYNYSVGDTLTLHYVEKASIGAVDLSSVMFDYGVVTDSELLYPDISADSLDLIRIKAPMYHETQSMVRSKEDFKKLTTTLIEGGKDVNGRDVSPAVIELVYVKEDGSLMTEQEKDDLIEALDSYRLFGTCPPTIIDPTKVDIPLDVSVTLLPGSSQTVSNIEDTIDDSLDDYTKVLGASFDMTGLEYDIERLDGVKYARVYLASGSPVVASGSIINLDWDEYAEFYYNLSVF